MDEVEITAPTTPTPPYLPFLTFWAFLTDLASKPLPPQIDRSMMGSKSGTDQLNLFSSLKFFDLIDDKLVVQDGLKAFVATDEQGRKRALEGMLRLRYPRQFEISGQNGTEKLLSDSFEERFGINGETRRKAVTFFLHAARFAGVELSAHFPVTRMGSGRPAGSRVRRVAKKATPPKPGDGSSTKTVATSPNQRSVTLSSGAVVTLSISADLFSLRGQDREFVFELIDRLSEYVPANPGQLLPGATTEDDGDGDSEGDEESNP